MDTTTTSGRDEMVRANDGARNESAINVLMERDRVVVQPVGPVDASSIEAIVGLVDCARDAGLIAVVDLDKIEPGDLACRDALERLTINGSSTSPSRI
jgi:hypothetical protein